MFNLETLLRPNIAALAPYSSARDEFQGDAAIFLDANENSLGSTGRALYNRYPDPHQVELKTKIAAIKGVKPSQIFLGNGSDEAIDLLFRAFCRPGKDRTILLPPTYGMYQVCAEINDVEIVKVNLTPDFQIDVEAVLSKVTPETKLIWVCSPNNPTGNCVALESIETLLKQFNGVVVVDEAYIDFCPERSLLPRLAEFENLVVLQTFSKAWGLANLRLGLAYASPEIISILSKIKYPYNVNGSTQALASEALDNLYGKNKMVSILMQERERLMVELPKLPVVKKVYPTDANFVMIKVDEARKMYDYLVANKIVVRDRSTQPLCEGCLRITIGTVAENDELLGLLGKL